MNKLQRVLEMSEKTLCPKRQWPSGMHILYCLILLNLLQVFLTVSVFYFQNWHWTRPEHVACIGLQRDENLVLLILSHTQEIAKPLWDSIFVYYFTMYLLLIYSFFNLFMKEEQTE